MERRSPEKERTCRRAPLKLWASLKLYKSSSLAKGDSLWTLDSHWLDRGSRTTARRVVGGLHEGDGPQGRVRTGPAAPVTHCYKNSMRARRPLDDKTRRTETATRLRLQTPSTSTLASGLGPRTPTLPATGPSQHRQFQQAGELFGECIGLLHCTTNLF